MIMKAAQMLINMALYENTNSNLQTQPDRICQRISHVDAPARHVKHRVSAAGRTLK
jgi:hypothetical protein